MEISSGKNHLDDALRFCWSVHEQSIQDHDSLTQERELLGTSLSALYQAATCHRHCYGGSHVLEALSGRIYNLAVSAYQLAMCGFYDEALNLTRSIGETANLISLSVCDKQALAEWLASDTKARLTKFSPSRVRKILKTKRPALLIASDDWYSDFCEKYTHVTPRTRPNLHAASGQAHVGGIYDSAELRRVITEIATIVGPVAMIVCRYVNFDDLFDDIKKIVRGVAGDDNCPR